MGVEVIDLRGGSNICSNSFTVDPPTDSVKQRLASPRRPAAILRAMARAVVVGGGFGGMATAARLAKIGHEVTLLEAGLALGGAVGSIEQDGFCWETGPTHTMLPAVVRDLFRKSGRPLERELDLVPVEPAHQHRFEDGVVLDMPAGSRGEQESALADALGPKSAAAWIQYVDELGPVWEVLRRDLFERPWSPEHASKEARKLLNSRQHLLRHVTTSLRDKRLQQLALYPSRLEGHQPRDVAAWEAVWAYVEQNFGLWRVPEGMDALTTVLTDRLATRGVTVHTATPARDLVLEGGGVRAVATGTGELDADIVVVATDPRRLPALARHVERTTPAIPPVMCHLGIVGDVPDLPAEVVIHGEPMLVVRTTGRAPDGAHAWTVLGRGRLAEDIVTALYRGGIKVRDQVEVRIDRSPRALVEAWNGSPNGVVWQGRVSFARRLGPDTPIPGVYLAGAHTKLGAGLPSVGLSAALVAQEIGPA